jgi:hypothetical protein
MKDQLVDENESSEVKIPKPVTTIEKNPPVKTTKPNKPTSHALTLKQALQNVSLNISGKLI